jgi:hypothetical protein
METVVALQSSKRLLERVVVRVRAALVGKSMSVSIHDLQ